MSDQRSLPATSTASAPAPSAELGQTVGECLATHYGVQGMLERLPGENLNFLVTIDGIRKYVLKIVDEHMPPAVVEMEFAAIEHALRAGFQARLPTIIENKHGEIETGINIHMNGLYRARLIEFIRGTDLSKISDISETALRNVGGTIAGFNGVMRDFDHPAAHRNHRWNLAAAGQHREKIHLIVEQEKRELLAWAYSVWDKVRRRLPELPWQFIHGDAHDENILMEGERVAGLIDFGDCCHNPTVCELATCLTYLMMRGDPARIAQAIVDGYREVRPLSPVEAQCLYPLVCGRLAISLCIANERKAIDPHNPNWFGGEGRAWALLRRLQDEGAERFSAWLKLAR